MRMLPWPFKRTGRASCDCLICEVRLPSDDRSRVGHVRSPEHQEAIRRNPDQLLPIGVPVR